MAIDIVSCPMKNGGSFHSYVNVRLPEANSIRFLDGKTTVSRSLGSGPWSPSLDLKLSGPVYHFLLAYTVMLPP